MSVPKSLRERIGTSTGASSPVCGSPLVYGTHAQPRRYCSKSCASLDRPCRPVDVAARRASARRYYHRHKAKVLDYQRTRYAASRDAIRSKQSVYEKAHPEIRRASDARRRGRIAGVAGSHTPADWLDKVALLGGCCIYCGRDDVQLTEDHKVPLSRGGSNDIENVVPACGKCNCRKGTRTAREFLSLAS